MSKSQRDHIYFSGNSNVRWANVAKRIPEPDNTVQVVYSSHMVEHLTRAEAARFFREVLRVLMPGGYVRISVPDLRLLVNDYVADEDGDRL